MRLERPEPVVLGIDPGLTRMGVGVVKATPNGYEFIASATIRTPPSVPHSQRLAMIQAEVLSLIDFHRPAVMACERVYLKSNSATAVGAIQAAGVAMAAAAAANIPVHDYSAAQVKLAVVGSGGASKHQVQFMLTKLLGQVPADTADAADALAVAITHLNHAPMRALQLVASR